MREKLCNLGVDLESRHQLAVSAATFDGLRWAAKWVASAPKSSPIFPVDKALLEPIVNNCEMIKEMFKCFKGFEQFAKATRADLAKIHLHSGSYTISPDD